MGNHLTYCPQPMSISAWEKERAMDNVTLRTLFASHNGIQLAAMLGPLFARAPARVPPSVDLGQDYVHVPRSLISVSFHRANGHATC